MRFPSGTACQGGSSAQRVLSPQGTHQHLQALLPGTLQLSQQIPFKLELAGAWLSGPFRAAVLFVSQGTFGDV